MTDVRSQRLAAYKSVAGGIYTLFIVPDNHVILLKGIEVRSYAEGPNPFGVHMSIGSATVTLFEETLENAALIHWAGWHALNPGDSLFIYAQAAGMDVWASGTVLAGPPPYPVLPGLGIQIFLPELLPAFGGRPAGTPKKKDR